MVSEQALGEVTGGLVEQFAHNTSTAWETLIDTLHLCCSFRDKGDTMNVPTIRDMLIARLSERRRRGGNRLRGGGWLSTPKGIDDA